MPRVDMKTTSMKEVIKKISSMGWDINKVKIEAIPYEDLSEPDEIKFKLRLGVDLCKTGM